MSEKKPLIIVDRDMPFIEGVMEPYFEIRYIKGKEISYTDVCDACALVVRTRTFCGKELLENSRIKLIVTATIGSDHIDMGYCAKAGICVRNASGCNSSAVMQYVYTSLYSFALKKKLSLKGKNLGVIGVGNVGKKVAGLGEMLGFTVMRNDPPREAQEGNSKGYFTPLPELLMKSDIITLHIPLSEENKGFADKTFFKSLKEGAVFINTSRGDVVDEDVLLSQRMRLSGIIIDVWKNEPDINLSLLNVVDIATPHIAGYSMQGKINATVASVRSVGEFFSINELVSFSMPEISEKIEINKNDSSKTVRKILDLYDIWKDDAALRFDPASFEKLRNGYLYRKDFYYE